jgi:hypothetical protein
LNETPTFRVREGWYDAPSDNENQRPRGLNAMKAPLEFEGVPISHVIDVRHKLTALIKENLYGGGSKSEGQAALIARNHLDDFLSNLSADTILKGDAVGLVSLKRAIILETYAELVAILDDYSCRFGRGGKAIKKGMSAVLSDPDVFGRFDADQQTKIQAIATGSYLFAKWRFDRLHLSIRREGGRYLPTPR